MDNEVVSLKKEMMIILIGSVIGAIIGAVALIAASGFWPLFGIWIGLGVGGNIAFFPVLCKKAGEFFGWWDPVNTLGFNIWIIFVNIFLVLLFAAGGFLAFSAAGPIWPLIRFLIKRGQIKKSNQKTNEKKVDDGRTQCT